MERGQLQGIYRESVREIVSKVDHTLATILNHKKFKKRLECSENRTNETEGDKQKGLQVDFAALVITAGIKGSRSKKKLKRQEMEAVQEKTNLEDSYDEEGFDASTVSYLKKSQMLSKCKLQKPLNHLFPFRKSY